MYLTLDGFRLVYGIIAAFMWLMTTIFSREYLNPTEIEIDIICLC